MGSLCLCALSLLAGCAAPEAVKLDRTTPPQWQQQESAQKSDPAALAHWWRAWNDPALNALVDEALVQLSKQQVPHIVARAVRRNASAMKFFKRSGFDWVRTEEYLLGRDM